MTLNSKWERIVESVPPPDLFLDFGPGRESVEREAWMAQEAWPNCSIIGIEACEARYTRLKNVYPGQLSHAAVDEHVGQTEGYVGGRHGMFKFWLEPEKGTKHQKVVIKTTTVDNLHRQAGEDKTIFIWADIEGAELRMLKGATSALSFSKVLGLNLELNPTGTCWKERPGAESVIDFLEEYDMECRGTVQRPTLKTGNFEKAGDFLFVNKTKESKP